MDYNTGALKVIEALRANMAAQVNWLAGCQITSPGSGADGAIKRYPDQGWVTPYFSNFAALAMLAVPSHHPQVERYLDWYLRNLEPNGVILDYHYDEKLNARTAKPDSEDAYAGALLSLAAAYHERAGQSRWAGKNLLGLKKVARSIIKLMDRDGLTFALAGYRVKYLMDNCEAYRGLADFAALLDYLGDDDAPYFKARADAMAAGIERALWNPRLSLYHPSKTGWFRAGLNLKKFYPDAACQVFPALYGLIEPGSARGARLYKLFNDHQPDWVRVQPPHYPWMILGYCACLQGDYRRAYEKLRHVREAYIDTGSGNWFCAEAAFFVLTCAKLIEKREEWLG